MEQPLVSVLMTVYNREKYLAEAIESVLSSTYDNWELIIVDDRSSDKSVEIAQKYSNNDKRIKVYINEVNLGQFRNRNKAATLATGKYIKYLDSDDLIYPHGLEVMVNAIEKFPTAGFATQNTKHEENNPYPIFLNKIIAFEKHFLNYPFLISGPSGVIFRKKAFDEVGGFDSDNAYVGSDTELLLKMACLYDVVLFPPALIWWRQHDQQAFQLGKKNNEYILNDYIRNKTIIDKKYAELSSSQNLRLIKRKQRNLQIGRIKRLVSSCEFKLAVKLTKQLF